MNDLHLSFHSYGSGILHDLNSNHTHVQGPHDEFFLDMFEDQFNHERVRGR